MKHSIIILITQLLLWGCCRSERSILKSFYKALDGDEWEHKENWLSDKPLNEWYGITTDEEGKVVKIQLSDTMIGKVPANLKHLKRLQYLHLNCITGGISLEVNKYPSLKELRLNGYINLLTVENCPELERLSLISRYFDNFHIDGCSNLSSLELVEHNISDTTKRELDLSPFPKLSELKIHHLALDQLHINNCFNLKKISIHNCQLEELDLSSCAANLEYLKVSDNDSLHILDLSRCVTLDSIDVSGNSITQLDISNCKKLRYLNCSDNKLPELELNNPLLYVLYCYNNEISKLNVGNFKELKYLYCDGNNLSELDISECKELEQLTCGFNNLSELDVRQNSKLYFIECGGNNLQSIDLSKNQELKDFRCEDSPLKKLDISHCSKLEYINIYGSQITTIDISHLDKLNYFKAYWSSLKTIWISKNFKPIDMWFIEDDVVCKVKQ